MQQKYFTEEGLEKLRKELDYLKNIRGKEIAQQLNQAAGFGDLSENAAYHQAKEALSFLRGRVLELEKILVNVKVVEQRTTQETIQVGSTVLLSCSGSEEKFKIVEAEEANFKERKISCQSPLGNALLGKKIEETVKIKTPDGNSETYKIKSIN